MPVTPEKVTLTNSEIQEAFGALRRLSQLGEDQLPSAFARTVFGQNLGKLKEKLQLYQAQREDINSEYAKKNGEGTFARRMDEEGNVIPNTFIPKNEKAEDLRTDELNELAEREHEIEVYMISHKKLLEANMRGVDWLVLDFMIEGTTEEILSAIEEEE